MYILYFELEFWVLGYLEWIQKGEGRSMFVFLIDIRLLVNDIVQLFIKDKGNIWYFEYLYGIY